MSAMDVDPRDGPGEPSTSFPPDLFELASDVAMVGAPPSDAVASQIFQMHPLPDVFAAIGEADEGSKREGDLCSFLDRMFQTGPGKAMLASAMPYARAGMQADSPRVRQLACTQLGRAAQQVAAAPEDSAGCLTSLVDAVGDEDSGVAAAAADALLAVSAASASIGGQVLTRVSESARNERRAEPRLRGHALAAAISAGAGAGDAAALTRALLLELDATSSDPLASMATMELVAEIVEKTPRSAVALALCDATLPRLAAVAAAEPGENENENDTAAEFARARAATVGARIASAASTARGSFPHASGGDALLDALASLLARAVQGEGDGELGEAACAAVTSLAESATAVAALCAGAKHDRVAILSRLVRLGLGGRRVPTGTRVAALHAVATFAGAGDQTGRKSRLAAPAAPHEPACGSAAAAETAEAAMRDAAYDAAEARGVTVGECVSESLAKGGDSFLELRIAAYRCVASLGRRPWFAAEVATSPKALALVTDPAYESTPPGCRWRHEAASGMLAAARAPRGVDASVSDGAAARLEAAVAGGPFGNGVGGQGAPRVAVAQR
jgi:hypothetical protein